MFNGNVNITAQTKVDWKGTRLEKVMQETYFPLIPTGDQSLDVIGSSGYGIYGDYCFRWPFVNLNPF